MTRFARAKGSKSSNERVPEQATSWSQMRKDLHRESVRKAAEEQIERESKISHQQNVNQKASLGPPIKRKPTEPVELVSFDDMPSVSKNCSQKFSNTSVSKKFPQHANNYEALRKKRTYSESSEIFDTEKYTETLSKPQIEDVLRSESTVSDNSSMERSEHVSSKKCHKSNNKSDNFSPRGQFSNGASNQTFISNNNRRPHNQHKTTDEEGEDSLSKIAGNFKGYPVPVEDADTLTDAYNNLRKEGLTHQQAMERTKPERRRAEKRLARLKSMICFRCRKPGHRLSDCPMGGIACDVCFKCGSTTHKYQDCKKKGTFVNAKCFICGIVGHLSAQCPENSHGVYPEGGECKICGEKSHLVKDCPQNRNRKEQHPGTTEFDDYFDVKSSGPSEPKKKKIIKVQF